MRTDHTQRGLEIKQRAQVRRFWIGLVLILAFFAALMLLGYIPWLG